MSADNWSTCPNCIIIRNNERKRAEKELDSSYGVVSAKEYWQKYWLLQKRLEALKEEGDNDTLEEYFFYDLSEDFVLYIRYSANCEVCGFSTGRIERRIEIPQ